RKPPCPCPLLEPRSRGRREPEFRRVPILSTCCSFCSDPCSFSISLNFSDMPFLYLVPLLDMGLSDDARRRKSDAEQARVAWLRVEDAVWPCWRGHERSPHDYFCHRRSCASCQDSSDCRFWLAGCGRRCDSRWQALHRGRSSPHCDSELRCFRQSSHGSRYCRRWAPADRHFCPGASRHRGRNI